MCLIMNVKDGNTTSRWIYASVRDTRLLFTVSCCPFVRFQISADCLICMKSVWRQQIAHLQQAVWVHDCIKKNAHQTHYYTSVNH